MDWARHYELADLGADPLEIPTWSETKAFRREVLHWSEPVEWESGVIRPAWPSSDHVGRAGLYIIMRDHRNQKCRNEIRYIGVAKNLHARLNRHYHKTARELVDLSGLTRISYALIHKSGHYMSRLKEIEDILMWAHWETIENTSCMQTLPSMRPTSGKGRKRSRPWLLENTGYDFGGRMPAEIIYPWMLVRMRKPIAKLRGGME